MSSKHKLCVTVEIGCTTGCVSCCDYLVFPMRRIMPTRSKTLLEKFEMPQFLADTDSKKCEECPEFLQKTVEVQPIGRALLIHLMRFDDSGRKLPDRVTFPHELVLGTARYAFAAAVEHIGATKREGHYIAHVHTRQFLSCNDRSVTRTTWDCIASSQPYMLAYVRVND